jgi:hypothetical protein
MGIKKLFVWLTVGVICAIFWSLVLLSMGTGWVTLALFFATAVTFSAWGMAVLSVSGDKK